MRSYLGNKVHQANVTCPYCGSMLFISMNKYLCKKCQRFIPKEDAKPVVYCKAICKDGMRCHNRATIKGYCMFHYKLMRGELKWKRK